MAKAETVDQYIGKHPFWSKELNLLRELLLSYKLDEAMKWGGPVYMLDGKNLFGLGAFKNHYAIWFFQGGLLEKNTSLLLNAQEGKTQAMRQMKFDRSFDLNLKELTGYIGETIALHKQGKKVAEAPPKEFRIAEGPKNRINRGDDLNIGLNNLTHGKQKEYSEYSSQAKREETKLSRLEKIMPLRHSGKGLNDKYKSC